MREAFEVRSWVSVGGIEDVRDQLALSDSGVTSPCSLSGMAAGPGAKAPSFLEAPHPSWPRHPGEASPRNISPEAEANNAARFGHAISGNMPPSRTARPSRSVVVLSWRRRSCGSRRGGTVGNGLRWRGNRKHPSAFQLLTLGSSA